MSFIKITDQESAVKRSIWIRLDAITAVYGPWVKDSDKHAVSFNDHDTAITISKADASAILSALGATVLS